jgi:hypothetical protein
MKSDLKCHQRGEEKHEAQPAYTIFGVENHRKRCGVMNDTISSRYRQLELPMRKENLVGIQPRKSEQVAFSTRHADGSFSLRDQEYAPWFALLLLRERNETARTQGGDVGVNLRISPRLPPCQPHHHRSRGEMRRRRAEPGVPVEVAWRWGRGSRRQHRKNLGA